MVTVTVEVGVRVRVSIRVRAVVRVGIDKVRVVSVSTVARG